MASFTDSTGDKWKVAFDAFSLDDARKDTEIDLADIAAGGWATIESNASAVVRVLASLCGEEAKERGLKPREFAQRIRGDAITRAREALRAEGADFFPPSEWSVIRSNLKKRRALQDQKEAATMAGSMTEVLPLMEAFSRLPRDIQARLIETGGDISSLTSEELESVAGPTDTPSTSATNSPESAEPVPAA